jgi:hypothetical protein
MTLILPILSLSLRRNLERSKWLVLDDEPDDG